MKRAQSSGILVSGRYEEALAMVQATGQLPPELGELIDDDEPDDDSEDGFEEESDDENFILYRPNEMHEPQLEGEYEPEVNQEPEATQVSLQPLFIDQFAFNSNAQVTTPIDNTFEQEERLRRTAPPSRIHTASGKKWKELFVNNPLVVVSDTEQPISRSNSPVPGTSHESLELLREEQSQTTAFFQRRKENQRNKILLQKCSDYFKNNPVVVPSTQGSDDAEMMYQRSEEVPDVFDDSNLSEQQKRWQQRCILNKEIIFQAVPESDDSDTD